MSTRVGKCQCCRRHRGLPGQRGSTGPPGATGLQGATGAQGQSTPPIPIGVLAYAVNGQPLSDQTWTTMSLQSPTFNYGMTDLATGITVPVDGLYSISWGVAITGWYRVWTLLLIDGVQYGSSTADAIATNLTMNSVSGNSVQRINANQTVSITVMTQIPSGGSSIVTSFTVNSKDLVHLSYLGVVRTSE